jgi:hypothetical protein
MARELAPAFGVLKAFERVRPVRFGSAKTPNTNTERSNRSGVRRSNQVREPNRGNITRKAQGRNDDANSSLRFSYCLKYTYLNDHTVLSYPQKVDEYMLSRNFTPH